MSALLLETLGVSTPTPGCAVQLARMATMAALAAFTPATSTAGRCATFRAQALEIDGAPAVGAPAAGGKKQKGKPVIAKQRVVLKFLWLEKNIGVSLDQDVPGHGSVPLSPYYFWPRKDAWEELRAKLESKSWISKKRTIILLNQATDIINLWQHTSSAAQ